MLSAAVLQSVSRIGWPPELATFLLAALPIIEMRGAIPFAHAVLGLSWFSSFFWAFLGSMMPAAAILWATEPVLQWCNRKSPFCKRVIGKVLDHTRDHFHKRHERFGELALLIVAAVPLPLFGVWSASLAAVVFGVRFRRALALIAIGNLIAGAIIVLAVAGLTSFIGSLP